MTEPPKFHSIGRLAFVAFFSVLYGIMSMVGLIFPLFTIGPSKIIFAKRRDKIPACLENEEYGQHGFIRCKNQNLRLHYVAKGDKDKPLMLFLHGYPEIWYSWRHQIKEFCNNYRTVAIDMRGYGESDKPIGISEYYIEKLAFDVKEVVEGLGYKSCVLVSHDWGGIVAYAFTYFYPDMVDRLIVCNVPHPEVLINHISSVRSQFKKSWYMFYFQIPFLPEMTSRFGDLAMFKRVFCGKQMGAKSRAFTEDDIEAFKYAFTPKGAFEGPINYYRAGLRYKVPEIISNKITELSTLTIWGTADAALEKDMAVKSADYVQDFTLKFIEGASHWVQQDEPELVNKYIREFLENKKGI